MPSPANLPPPFSVSADFDAGDRIRPYLVDRNGDVEIRRGPVPMELEGEGHDGIAYQIREGRALIRVPNGARYLIEEGRRIVYAGDGNLDRRDIMLFLFGSAWGVLCYQRGLIPFHASAVAAGEQVHAFTGMSGAGKSTLAAALAARGRPFFADDVLVLDPRRFEPKPLCFAGYKELKLWHDAIALTGCVAGDAVRSVEGFPKFYAQPASRSTATAGYLKTLVMLAYARRGEKPNIERITGARAVTRLAQSVYRPAFAEAILGRKALYEALADLSGRIGLYRFGRHRFGRNSDPKTFAGEADYVDNWIGEQS
jgi:hypothetical protein